MTDRIQLNSGDRGVRERLLVERARRLAKPWTEDDGAERTTLLTFAQDAERFALDAKLVRGVFRLKHITPLPGAPPVVAGLTAWRGHILTVADLERLLDIPRSGLDDRAWVLVVEANNTTFGLLAGSIGEVMELRNDRITAPDDARGDLVAGIAGDAVLILDGPALSERLTSGAAQ